MKNTQRIGKETFILLLGKKHYLIKPIKFSCEFGFADLRKTVGKKFGTKVKIGKEEFTVVRPNVLDFLKKAHRGPQVILPKDAGLIMSVTGCSPGWNVIDAGSGSGFLTMFLANIGCNVHGYEKSKEFYNIAKKNVEKIGLKNVSLRNADITKGIRERDLDMITLDMKDPYKAVKHAFGALRPGGWLAIYSMHVEEMSRVVKEIKKYDFVDIKMLECLHREWQSVKQFTRPRNFMLAHTGFVTFARKL
jgi:tRNA (adenine57-N1/adenine58-N1)-methyltransferase catalytic subunit